MLGHRACSPDPEFRRPHEVIRLWVAGPELRLRGPQRPQEASLRRGQRPGGSSHCHQGNEELRSVDVSTRGFNLVMATDKMT